MILINNDCIKAMVLLPDKSVDMIFTDLPYGTTQNKWDCQISLEDFWKQSCRIIKSSGCIALFAQSPFDKILACSNLEMYRYEWIIEKTKATGHLNSKKMPMKAHENVLIFYEEPLNVHEKMLVFYKKLPTYNPQMTDGHTPVHSYSKHTDDGSCYGKTKTGISGGGSTQRYPRDILTFKWDTQTSNLHPTQKPLDLCEYFIKTYTNEGNTVLDCCLGSNTTGLACKKLKRHYIGIEKDKQIFEIAKKRLEE